jgi:hypothetical protein
MSLGVELARRLASLEGEVRRLRAGLVRVGTVASVDATEGTITVTYVSGVTSAPMPWFQRGSEHRPPRVAEHVVVLDPSLAEGPRPSPSRAIRAERTRLPAEREKRTCCTPRAMTSTATRRVCAKSMCASSL